MSSNPNRSTLAQTGDRVMGTSAAINPSSWQSTSRSSFSVPTKMEGPSTQGSRAARREQLFEAQCRAELRQTTATKTPTLATPMSLAQESFAAPGADAYGVPGRKHMYTQDGAPIVSHRSGHGAQSSATAAQISHGARGGGSVADVLNERPVTIYTQRLADGVLHGATSRGGAPNPFAKNSRWTNDIRDPRNITAGAVDRLSVAELGDGCTVSAGGHLSMIPIAKRILEAAVKSGGMHGARALRRALCSMTTPRALGSVLASIGSPLLTSEVDRLVVWLEALPARSTAAKALELMALVSDDLTAGAAAIVDEAFSALDRASESAGAVAVDFLTTTYDAKQDVAVVSNALSAESALREFSAEMFSLAAGSPFVDRAAFATYFTDVRAAVDDERLFRQHVCGVWRYVGVGMRGLKVTVTQRDVVPPVSTVEVLHTEGLGPLDFHKMRARLHRQGVHKIVRIELATGEAFDFDTL